MAYKPIDRSFDRNYLKIQHGAMRWLKTLGLTHEEIRTFHWGNVVETERRIRVWREVYSLKIDMKTREIDRKTYEKEFTIPLKGTPYENFFIKSRIWCHWVFPKERPRTWRMEGSRNHLYSLSDVEEICAPEPSQISINSVDILDEICYNKSIEIEHYKNENQRAEEAERNMRSR